MRLPTASYRDQKPTWPRAGRHIMASFTETAVTVVQAYRPEIGRFAVEHQRFGGPFSMGRMSWVKPNFLWMMYRSGWGTKPEQEVTLAVTLRRPAFDAISDVRLQWDSDHSPTGEPVVRRAVQLGLRGRTLERYAAEWIVSIEDVSAFVDRQRRVLASDGSAAILVPVERVYPVAHDTVAGRLGTATVEGTHASQ